MERDQQILGELECLNNGKPVKIARCVQRKPRNTVLILIPYSVRDFDIGDSIGCLRYYAGWADKILGQVLYPQNALFMEALTFGFRASKSIARLRLLSHIRSQLASADRCLSQKYARLIATKLFLTESHGTIPFKCGMSNTTAEIWTSFICKIQGMESRACTCRWLHDCHEALRSYSTDCAGTPSSQPMSADTCMTYSS